MTDNATNTPPTPKALASATREDLLTSMSIGLVSGVVTGTIGRTMIESSSDNSPLMSVLRSVNMPFSKNEGVQMFGAIVPMTPLGVVVCAATAAVSFAFLTKNLHKEQNTPQPSHAEREQKKRGQLLEHTLNR
jgi:hypothetical protein